MPDGPRSGRGAINVIVVEDDPDACESLVDLLELEGFRVAGFHDARSALARISAVPDAILVTDVTLPDQDGISLGMEATARFHDCRIILVSGHAPGSRNHPADWAWLQKPVAVDLLVECIVRLAATRVRPGRA